MDMTGEYFEEQAASLEPPVLHVVADYDAMTARAADVVAGVVRSRPTAAITLPTGSTPTGLYRELIARAKQGSLDLSRMQLFCLDEYLGRAPEDEVSLTRMLIDEFIEPANLSEEQVHYIPSTADNPRAAADAYENEIVEAGGLDLTVLGLGPNGHIAFNEPGSPPESRTRVVDLTAESREQNSAYYGGAEIPAQAMTIGIGTILAARRILMIVSGESKAGMVRQMLEGPMTSDVPASWLRLAGSRYEVILDEAAASGLSGR